MKKIYLISAVFVFFAILFALLKDVFSASVYLSLSCLIALSVTLAIKLIYSYYQAFYQNFEERFDFYLAGLVNSSSLSAQDVEMGREALKKKFKKTLLKDKLYEIAKIILVFMIMVTAIVAIIRH